MACVRSWPALNSHGEVALTRLLAEVKVLAARLPAVQRVLIWCSDRYHFGVALAAAPVSRKVSLLSPIHSPRVIRQVRGYAPDVFCLANKADCAVDLPQFQYPPSLGADTAREHAIPEIALVVCATASLSSELAQEVETRCNTRLTKIYGSTETGQVAPRHTTRTPVWDLFPGTRFSGSGDCKDGARASGGSRRRW